MKLDYARRILRRLRVRAILGSDKIIVANVGGSGLSILFDAIAEKAQTSSKPQ